MRKPYKRHDLVIAGRSISDWGLKVSDVNVFDSPVRSQEEIVVPGRNGTLIIDNGSWKNIDITYTCYFEKSNFAKSLADFQSYLGKLKGYQRIEDTIRLGEYRLANLSEMVSIKRDGAGYHSGVFDITFNCKPQRFLKSGEEPIYIIPPYFSGTTMQTQKYEGERMPLMYAYAYEGVTFGSLTYNVYYYSGDDLVDTYTETITRAGMLTAYTGTVFDHWRAAINFGSENPDNYFFTIGVNPESNSITQGTALWARTIKIQNPTGFVCKPLIHSVGAALPLKRVTLSDGEIWQINCDDYSHLTTSTYLDCENEYFYYIEDGKKKNITNYMTITHTDGDENNLPVSFPVFGEDETTFYVYVMGTNAGQFLEIYPRWYTI